MSKKSASKIESRRENSQSPELTNEKGALKSENSVLVLTEAISKFTAKVCSKIVRKSPHGNILRRKTRAKRSHWPGYLLAGDLTAISYEREKKRMTNRSEILEISREIRSSRKMIYFYKFLSHLAFCQND